MKHMIQDAIIASFLWSNDTYQDTKDAFLIDTSIFDREMTNIANLINKETQNDRFYGLLNMKIEQSYPAIWLRLSAQTPLPFSVAKKYHSELEKMNRFSKVDMI